MVLNEKDKELFKALTKSQIGKELASYLERLCDDVCDARTWSKDDTKESSMQAAKVIKENIINKIVPVKDRKSTSFDYE